jgi:hypothetical protein
LHSSEKREAALRLVTCTGISSGNRVLRRIACCSDLSEGPINAIGQKFFGLTTSIKTGPYESDPTMLDHREAAYKGFVPPVSKLDNGGERCSPNFGYGRRGIVGLKSDLVMAAIAERLVGGSAATAERKCRLAGQIVPIAFGIHHFHYTIRIINAQRTILAHSNCHLPHEASSKRLRTFKL